jgi:hypothetical protein
MKNLNDLCIEDLEIEKEIALSTQIADYICTNPNMPHELLVKASLYDVYMSGIKKMPN